MPKEARRQVASLQEAMHHDHVHRAERIGSDFLFTSNRAAGMVIIVPDEHDGRTVQGYARRHRRCELPHSTARQPTSLLPSPTATVLTASLSTHRAHGDGDAQALRSKASITVKLGEGSRRWLAALDGFLKPAHP
jgi:hypothetical protein